ncbi:hypothetical protein JB92DRAFT_2598859, partial [Gautieria morchelliformis]
GQYEDLDVAISFYQEALDLRPPLHPDLSASLHDLGYLFCKRFGQFGQYEDLESAISFHQEALELRPPPHPD